jgi:hypothetical protein
MELLEEQQHYKVPDATRESVRRQILSEVNQLIKKAS